eukprot:TRINITY_DN4036_c1_g1_i1.p1 TRINITY_DN4036_c1_g1~~TRINITY_DN4036_c1_g1_i1.p1  ORF type:complete len:565 (-),score=69.52 TRINITY_DN4036_c1_g1_i1:1285-2946(-)
MEAGSADEAMTLFTQVRAYAAEVLHEIEQVLADEFKATVEKITPPAPIPEVNLEDVQFSLSRAFPTLPTGPVVVATTMHSKQVLKEHQVHRCRIESSTGIPQYEFFQPLKSNLRTEDRKVISFIPYFDDETTLILSEFDTQFDLQVALSDKQRRILTAVVEHFGNTDDVYSALLPILSEMSPTKHNWSHTAVLTEEVLRTAYETLVKDATPPAPIPVPTTDAELLSSFRHFYCPKHFSFACDMHDEGPFPVPHRSVEPVSVFTGTLRPCRRCSRSVAETRQLLPGTHGDITVLTGRELQMAKSLLDRGVDICTAAIGANVACEVMLTFAAAYLPPVPVPHQHQQQQHQPSSNALVATTAADASEADPLSDDDDMTSTAMQESVPRKTRRPGKSPKNAQLGRLQAVLKLGERARALRESPPEPLPCSCNGDCDAATCSCLERKMPCDLMCGCPPGCKWRHPGCDCEGPCKEKCPCAIMLRECLPDLCQKCASLPGCAPTRCQNMWLQSGLRKPVKIARSDIHGWGLYVLEAVRKDEFIGEYVAEVHCYGTLLHC